MDLFLQAGGLEGEQELLDVVFSELVNAASVNGSPQKFIHLILGVHGLLNAAAAERRGGEVNEEPRGSAAFFT